MFSGNWLAVGRADQVVGPGDYFSGVTAGEPYIVVRDTVGLHIKITMIRFSGEEKNKSGSN